MAENIQIVGFELGNERYGVNIMSVESIIKLQDVTPVPRAPNFVEGIINLRGSIIPIVDLRKRLGIASKPANEESRIIITILDNRRLGVIVDKVAKVMHIPSDSVDDVPGTATAAAQRYIAGVARTNDGMIIILNVTKIFSAEERAAMANLGK